MRCRHHVIALALPVFLWTGTGESSGPPLNAAELPAEILADCAVAIAATRSACSAVDFHTQWIGRTPRGELYRVAPQTCRPQGCRSWLVARDQNGTSATLLAVAGELRLEFGQGKFPVAKTRLELAESYTSYTRFEWSGEQYVRIETRLVHRVDGFECADETECLAAAQEALRHDRPGRAVRIWQQVHGVNWI